MPVPPLPTVATSEVSVNPTQIDASTGFLEITGETGCSTTVTTAEPIISKSQPLITL